MSTVDLQELVDALAERLGRSVAVDDPAFRLIVASRHFGDEDRLRVYSILNRSVPDEVRSSALGHGIAGWRDPGRIPGNAQLGYSERVCVPVRYLGELLGYAWLIAPWDEVAAAELAMTSNAASQVGEVLHLRRRHQGEEEVRCEALVRAVVFGAAPERAEAVRELGFPEHEDPRLLLVAVEAGDERAVRRVCTALRAPRRGVQGECVLVSARAGVGVFAHVADTGDLEAVACAMRVCDGLRRGPEQVSAPVVGVSAAARGWAAVPELYRQAVEAVDIGRRRGRPALAWHHLGAEPLLLRLLNHTPQPAWPGAAAVSRLLGRAGTTALVDSAEVYLDCAADVRQAAENLHIHRTTLYYRLHRIEEVTGLDLSDGDDRLTLHVAVRLHRLGGFDTSRSLPA